MRKTFTLLACMTMIGMTTTVTSCTNKPEVQNEEVKAPASSNDTTKQDEKTPDTQKATESSDDAIKQDEKTPDTQKAPESSDDAIKQDEHTPDTQDVIDTDDKPSETSTMDGGIQENVKVELCTEGNCPCGDGFCARNSVCIKDKCFCGAFLEKGFIDNYAIVSNSYGEFECAKYISYEQCTIYRAEYNFICTQKKGCKTKDGRKFPLINQSDLENYKDVDMYGMYVSREGFDIIYKNAYKNVFPENTEFGNHLILKDDTYQEVEYSSKEITNYADDSVDYYDDDIDEDPDGFTDYKELIKKHRLNNCGKPLPEDLKYLRRDLAKQNSEGPKYLNYKELVKKEYSSKIDREYHSVKDFAIPSDLECDLRMSCNESGVKPEHINEYVCEIGTKYFKQLCETKERNRAIGLRCIQPEGCSCGNTQCPENSLCKDGACVYDIYYENHSCPNSKWDANKSDIENYKKIAENCDCKNKVNELCYNECVFHTDADSEECLKSCEYDDNEIKQCYKECYWKNHNNTMTKTDPCKKSQ